MAIVTIEDLQGSIEVVVFPRLYEQTGPTWQDGAILLVAGRIDHRGEEVSLLADLVRDFDAASAAGEESFAAEVAAADRGRPRGRPAGNGNGRGGAPDAGRTSMRAPGVGAGGGAGPGVGGGSGPGAGGKVGPGASPRRGAPDDGVPRTSPIRATARLEPPGAGEPDGPLRPGAPGGPPVHAPGPVPGSSEPADLAAVAPDREEPAFPEETRAAALRTEAAPTVPREAGPGGCLHVRFSAGLPTEDLQAAMAEVRDVLRSRPGATRVTIHLPQGAGRPALPMELRVGVAYDAELMAEVTKRLRPGLVDLSLTADGDGIAASA
jgi:hypothetical protein